LRRIIHFLLIIFQPRYISYISYISYTLVKCERIRRSRIIVRSSLGTYLPSLVRNSRGHETGIHLGPVITVSTKIMHAFLNQIQHEKTTGEHQLGVIR